MSNEALALVERHERSTTLVVITTEQVDLIKRTIAQDATDAELQLFFYDCKRRGVHPLDKLIHFTKRAGKYTPVTSIDYFRSRAAETKEHMGTADAVFVGTPKKDDFAASVTVFRMVQGEKCPFTATARWSEYCPDEKNAFMWSKMPHGQLGKCAEALALRKGFPQELADLHTFEEMAQASTDDENTGDQRRQPLQPPQRKSEQQNGKAASPATVTVPEGAVLVTKTDSREGEKNGRKWVLFTIHFSDGKVAGTFDTNLAAVADMAKESKRPMWPVLEAGNKPGVYKLTSFKAPAEPASAAPASVPSTENTTTAAATTTTPAPATASDPISAEDIPWS